MYTKKEAAADIMTKMAPDMMRVTSTGFASPVQMPAEAAEHSTRTCPSGQLPHVVHISDPGSAYWFGSHVWHPAAEPAGEYLPAGQFVHSEAGPFTADLPGPHAIHFSDPVEVLYEPGLHVTQVPAEPPEHALRYLPAGQPPQATHVPVELPEHPS